MQGLCWKIAVHHAAGVLRTDVTEVVQRIPSLAAAAAAAAAFSVVAAAAAAAAAAAVVGAS